MTDARSRSKRPTSISVVEAVRRIGRVFATARSRSEIVPIREALGRVPWAPLRAHRTLPPCDLALMDGFAIRSLPPRPGVLAPERRLRAVGRAFPGDDPRRLPRVDAGSAVEVGTGAPLPVGANAVARREDCRRRGPWVRVRGAIPPGRDLVRRGEDFRPGQLIAPAGGPLRPWHIAALAADGVRRVRVLRPTCVALLTTGAEVVPPDRASAPGRVRDSTKPLLQGMLSERGATWIDLGSSADRESSLRGAVRRGLARSDAVITIGGSSGGSRDLVRKTVAALPGAAWVVPGLRLRPGSTTSVARVGRTPVFLLPGPPVAAYAAFLSVVEPFLRSRPGAHGPARAVFPARLAARVAHSPEFQEVVRVRVTRRRGRPYALPAGKGGSSRLSTLTGSDGVLVLDEGHGDYPAGASVRVRSL